MLVVSCLVGGAIGVGWGIIASHMELGIGWLMLGAVVLGVANATLFHLAGLI